MKVLSRIILITFKISRRLLMLFFKPMFKKIGKNVVFSPFDSFSYSNIEIGNNVSISSGAHFSSIKSIYIGDKVMFGPNVTILGGDHNVSELGKYMFDVNNKKPEDDLDIIIEDDVWISSGVTILKGVTIGRGSIIGASALVNKSIPPNSIAVGIPAKVIKDRFNETELKKHLNLLKSLNSKR